jgi:DNA polymerase-4
LVEPSAIEDGVRAMADEVWHWCEKAQEFGRTVTVKIKYADFQQATRSRTLPAPVQSHDALRAVSVELVRSVFPPAKGIRLLGVAVSGFERGEAHAAEQLGLGL